MPPRHAGPSPPKGPRPLPSGPVSESELIERSDELMAIERALDAARGKEGCCAWIEGPAGIGKTSLAAEACRMGAARGFRVLEATGVELERGFPFGVVRQLYEPFLRGLDPTDREALAQGAATVFGAAAPDGGDADLSFQVLHGLYWLVAELAQRDPLLIAIDDAQWADYPSLRHLLYLCRRLEGLAVIVMIAERTGEEAPTVLDELRETAAARIEPQPLSASGALRLARAIFDAEPSPDFISASVERTGGSPVLPSGDPRALRDEDLRPDDSSIEAVGRIDAEGLARHVSRRIESVDRAAPSVAGAIAVLGERARPGRVALLSDVPAAQVAGIVEQLRDRGILDGGDVPCFTHPVIRAAVEARISAGQLDAWHRSAARLLDREGAGADHVAGHLLSCLPEDDPWALVRRRPWLPAFSPRSEREIQGFGSVARRSEGDDTGRMSSQADSAVTPDRHDVRKARPAQAANLAGTLARAFYDDPLFSWLLPDPSRRLAIAGRGFDLYLREVWLRHFRPISRQACR